MPEPSYAPDAVDDLIVRFFCRETVPDEHRFLREWIDRSPANRARFIGFRNVYLSSLTLCRDAERSALTERGLFLRRRAAVQAVQAAQASQASQASQSEQTAQTAQAAQTVEPLRPKRPTRSRPSPRSPHPLLESLSPCASRLRRTASAAAVVLFAAGLWCGLPQLRRPDRPTVGMPAERVEFSVSFGSRASTTLPDGSRIRLNAGSRISYAPDFNRSSREVRLEGEAYFDVRTDPAKPFVVQARDLSIVATGTAFNVSAYEEDPAVTTTLVRGAVTIDGAHLAEPIRIAPNQTVACFGGENGRAAMARVLEDAQHAPVARDVAVIPHLPALRMEDDPLVRTSWKEERWVIESERLESLMARIERRYNVSVRFDGDRRIRDYRFNGSFEGETIDEVLRIIRRALPVDYEIDKGIVRLFPDERLQRRFDRAAARPAGSDTDRRPDPSDRPNT